MTKNFLIRAKNFRIGGQKLSDGHKKFQIRKTFWLAWLFLETDNAENFPINHRKLSD